MFSPVGKILFLLTSPPPLFYIHHAYLVNVLANGTRGASVASHGSEEIIFWKYGTYGLFYVAAFIYERVTERDNLLARRPVAARNPGI